MIFRGQAGARAVAHARREVRRVECHRGGERRLVAPEHGHPEPVGDEPLRDRPADALAAAGDHRMSSSHCDILAAMARPKRRPAFLGQTAIVGVGYTDLSKRSGRSVLALATEACRNAVHDAGLTLADLDGIASFRFMEDSVPTSAVATTLGLDPANYLLDSALGGQAP